MCRPVGARMTRNQHRRTPLHHAAAKNRPGMVELLLELGADPNLKDAPGATAMKSSTRNASSARRPQAAMRLRLSTAQR